jgi:hypothetical protein
LKILAKRKVSADNIAKSLGRYVGSVKIKARELNLILSKSVKAKGMTDDNPVDVYEVIRDEPALLPSQAMDAPLLLTASELRDRQTIRRRKRHLSTRSEGIRRLVELGLKARGK